MGTIEELKSVRQPLLMGTTTHAARRDGNVIIHVASGITHIGPAREQPGDYSYLADTLQSTLPDVARTITFARNCGANWRSTARSIR